MRVFLVLRMLFSRSDRWFLASLSLVSEHLADREVTLSAQSAIFVVKRLCLDQAWTLQNLNHGASIPLQLHLFRFTSVLGRQLTFVEGCSVDCGSDRHGIGDKRSEVESEVSKLSTLVWPGNRAIDILAHLQITNNSSSLVPISNVLGVHLS